MLIFSNLLYYLLLRTVSVDAVVYYRISNPTVSVANVENAHHSTRLLAQTTLRNMLGTKNLSEILSDREAISTFMQVRYTSLMIVLRNVKAQMRFFFIETYLFYLFDFIVEYIRRCNGELGNKSRTSRGVSVEIKYNPRKKMLSYSLL